MREWQPIETAPETGYESRIDVLVYSKRLGVKSGILGRKGEYVHVGISSFHGNAVEDWGVTHWMPLPPPPQEAER